jgi:hypothetical protein
VIIHEDNVAAINLISNGGSLSEGSRHIETKYFFTSQYVKAGVIELAYCNTNDMVADALTKPLMGIKFQNSKNTYLVNRRQKSYLK